MRSLEYFIILSKNYQCKFILPNYNILSGAENAIKSLLEEEFGVSFSLDDNDKPEEIKSFNIKGFSKEDHNKYKKIAGELIKELRKRLCKVFNNRDRENLKIGAETTCLWAAVKIESREDINMEVMSEAIEEKRLDEVSLETIISGDKKTYSLLPAADIDRITS